MIKTKIKRLLSTFLVAVMVLSISSVQIFAEESPTGEAPIKQAVSIMALASTAITIDRTRTLDSIVAMAKALPHSGFDSSIVTRYAVDPIFTSPHSAGTLNADDVADALNAFKMVRYVAGLSYENLNFKAELNNYSQHAAVYLAVTNQLTHGPTDLGGFSQNFFDLAYIGCNQANLYSGISNISASILGFVRDPGASNIAVAGHRRWLLKPGGKNYGIGYAKYATNLPRISMHTLDTEGAGDADTYIAWPSSGDFPIQYFTASNNINATAEPPWSINLGDAYSVPTRESINLVLTRASDGKTWTFNSSTPTLGDGNYPANDSQHLSVDNDGYGMRKAIIFRPDLTSLGAIKDGEIFTVNLSGIKTSAGEATTLTYNVNFFDLEKEMARSRVNITVKNGSTPISGATVEIDGKTLTTDASGLATLRVNNGASYPYTVSKTGYHTETGTVAVTSDAVSVDVSLLVPVSFVISDISKTYNGTAQGVTVSATPNAAYTVKYNGSAQVPTDAGTYSVTVEADSPNVGSATATLTISKANIAVKADDNAKKVGESDPGLTHTVTSGSLFSPDSFTGALARVAGEAVNTYAINQGTLALSANYNLTFTPGVFTITDKTPQNITVTGITVDGTTSKTYGDAPFGVTATPDSASGLNSFTYVSSDTNVAEISNTGQITIKSAGTTTITVSQAGNADYAAFTASTTLSVAKVAIAVTAENKTKKIGSSDPVLTYTFTGTLVSGDIFTGALARVAGDAVDTYAINQGTLALSSNYSLTFTPGVFTITEKTPQNITVTGIAVGGTTSKTYGDAPFVVTATPDTASGLTDFTFASSDTNVAEISDSGQITIKSAGTTTITVSQAGNADYAAFTASTTLSVAKVAIAVTAENKTKKIGSDDPDLTYTFTGTLVSGDIFTGALARVAGDAVGTYPINQGTLALSANYNLTFTPGVFTITDKTPQNVTVTGITVGGTTSKTYGDVPFVVTATPDSASGLTDFTFTSSDTSVAEISGAGQITIKNAGTTTITVSQAGDTEYAPFTASTTLSVAKVAIAVTAENKTKKIGSDDPDLTYTFTGTLVSGDNFTGVLARVAGDAVGTYAINQGTLALSANYSLTFTPGVFTIIAKTPQTITVTGITVDGTTSKTYGDAPFGVTATPDTASGLTDFTFASSDTNVAEISNSGQITIKNEGTTTITVSQAGNADYAAFTASTTLSVAKVAIAVTAENKTKKIGSDDPDLTYTKTGILIGSDSFTGELARATGEEVGTYAINQGTLALSANYSLTFTPGVFTIIAKTPQNITVTGITVEGTTSKTYGDASFGVTVAHDTTSGLTDFTFTSSDTSVAEISGAGQITIKNAGTTTITVSQAGDTEYAPFTASTTLSVAKVAIAVTAENKTKKIGSDDPDLTYTKTGTLIGSDSFTGALARATGEEVGTYAINQGTLALSSNYSLTFTPGVFTIIAKTPQNITVTGIADKAYGNAPFSLTVAPDPTALLSDFSFSSSNPAVAEISATGQITIKGSGVANISVSEPGDADYAAFEWTQQLTVSKTPLDVTADDKSITYGDPLPEWTITYSGFVYGEDESDLPTAPSAALTTSGKINAGNHALVVSGGVSNNYDFNYLAGVLDVAKKDITVSGAALSVYNKEYQAGDKSATVKNFGYSFIGVVPGDDVSIDISALTAEFDDDAIGTGKNVTISGIVLRGSDKGNYNLTSTTIHATADIVAVLTAQDVADSITGLPSLLQDATQLELPIVPPGFTVSIKSASNPTVDLDGNVLPVDSDTDVAIILTVTKTSDQTTADTAPITVTVPSSTKYEIIATAIGGTVSGQGTYNKNANVVLTSEPNENYTFDGWYENGAKISGAGETYSFTATSDRTLEARFTAPFVITATAGEGGTVSGGGTFASGSTVTLTAAPNENYTFDGWYENGTKISGAGETYSFTATADRTLEARFTAPYVITATAGEGGSVSGGGTYSAGETVTLTAAPNASYTFNGWYEGGARITGAGATYTFVATADRTLEARFAYSSSSGDSGSGSSGSGSGGGGSYTPPATPSSSFTGGNSFAKGSGAPLVLTINKGFSLFRDVRIAGTALTRNTHYKAESGTSGTIVTFLADYLNTLPVGQHTVEVRFTDGTAVSSTFKIAEGSATAWTNPFTDVRQSDWFYEAVKYAQQKGLVSGTSATSFSPQATMTRSMMVTILWNYSGKPQSGSSSFTDAASGSWYADAVNWAASNGIVAGYGNGLFGPNDEISREQMAVILYNYTNFSKATLPSKRSGAFVDAAQISPWARQAVSVMYAAEVLNGKGRNDFDPKSKATRAEVVAMMRSYLELISD